MMWDCLPNRLKVVFIADSILITRVPVSNGLGKSTRTLFQKAGYESQLLLPCKPSVEQDGKLGYIDRFNTVSAIHCDTVHEEKKTSGVSQGLTDGHESNVLKSAHDLDSVTHQIKKHWKKTMIKHH